jgi:putative mycofactocin binding protein MftB
LSPGVKVRQESSGLLFYSSKDSKLTFVKCGNLIDADCLSQGEGFRLGGENEDKVELLLEELVKKGLLFGERADK